MIDLTLLLEVGAAAAGGGGLVWYLRAQKGGALPLPGRDWGDPKVSTQQELLEIDMAGRGASGDAMRRFKKAARDAGLAITSYISPYCLGYLGDGLELTSMARLDSNAEGTGKATDYTMGLAALLGVFKPEAAEEKAKTEKATTFTAGAGVKAAKAEAKLLDKIADTRDYDAGKIQAEMAELSARFPDKPGMNPKPADDNMPMQTIRNADGEVLMKGRAESVEHLIALKLDEAGKSLDPSKRIVNLAGAQLDENTLGRKADFEKFNFQNVNLRGANLGGAQFKECQFKNVDMEGVNLKKANIQMSHFENVNMAKFTADKDTKLKNCSLKNVDMSEADAPGMKLEGIRAEHLNIEGANFTGSSWTDVKVENLYAKDAILNGVKWGKVDISGRNSNFENVQMKNAQVANSSFGTPEHGLNMKGLQAQGSTWTDVQFNKADLSSANFEKATFTRVDMRRVITPRGPMNMSGAEITGLNAGPEAKMIAVNATHSGVELHPQSDFVFSGTAPLARAADEANKAGVKTAEIISSDGATRQAEAAGLMQQRKAEMARRMQMQAPQPKGPWERKG